MSTENDGLNNDHNEWLQVYLIKVGDRSKFTMIEPVITHLSDIFPTKKQQLDRKITVGWRKHPER